MRLQYINDLPVIAGNYCCTASIFFRSTLALLFNCSAKLHIMADNLNNRGQQDRSRVNSDEKWELAYLKGKMGVTTQQIEQAVKSVGNDRKKVEEYLKAQK